MEKSQTDIILDWIKDKVEQKKADFDANFWLEVGMKLIILLPDEIAKLYDFQKNVAQIRLDILGKQEKRNVSEVKMIIEASDEYRNMKVQEAKIKQIEEIVRIAKLQSRLNGGI